METPEEIHRQELKKINYKDHVIDELVARYKKNFTYEFAESYHKIMVQKKLNDEQERKINYWASHLENKQLSKPELVENIKWLLEKLV